MVVSTVGDISRAKDAAVAQSTVPAFDGLPWGRWQARTTLLAGLCKVTTAWHMAMVLYASAPSPFGEFRCPRRDAGLNHSARHNQSVDGLVVADDDPYWGSGFPTAANFWDWTWEPWVACDGDSAEANASNATECTNWLDLQTVNQWSGACHRQFVGGSSQFFYLVGIATGGAICMTLLRHLSPRRVLLAALPCEAVLAFVLSGVQVFWAHALVRFFLAIASSHLFTAAAALSADVCMPRAKLLTLSLFEIWWSLGIISISVFGNFALNWTCLQAIVSMPSFALVLPCALLLPESPRWLVSRGRLEEAVTEWQRGAAANKQDSLLPHRAALLQRLAQQSTAMHSQRKTERSAWLRPADGHRCRHVAKLVAAHIAFGCITNTFFGSILNVRNWGTPGMLGLSVGEATAGVSGIVGLVIGTLVSTRTSRPLLWLGVLLLAGGITGQFAHLVRRTEDGIPYGAKVTLFALAERVAVAAAVPTLNNCVPPVVAAPQRPSLVFSCVLFGRVCLFAAPFVGNLVVFGEAFPLTAFGLQLITAGLCSLALAVLAVTKTPTHKDGALKT
ncbi:solute carrier family 22 member 12-like isoform X2 [Thrips palmi]|nr:solute carrier family 22 member 12-like isoform X2 [Thrips palmi]